MKKPTFSRLLLIAFLFLLSFQSFGQVLKTFAKRHDENLKGDILVIGNNILNRDFGTAGNRANDSYDDLGSASVHNEDMDLKWINVDPDGGNNINSSSANLSIPAASKACYGIVYAGLYWSGTYTAANRSAITNVRLKTPTTGYKPLTGTVIYDYVGNSTANSARNPYACFIDITAEVKAAKEGTYTLANIACSQGGNGTSAGHSAGWSIFVIYEDPNLPNKYITSYDGFTRIKSGDPDFTFPINGFKTIPSGSVDAKVAFAALEGDNKDNGDAMTIQGNTKAGSAIGRLYCALRPASIGTPNFFNSTINDGDVYFTNRNPKSKNTLGYDTGVLKLPNSGNTVIQNGETGADITLSTSNDWYYLFFTALAVNVIEPKVVLTKIVQDKDRNDIGGQTVALGAPLYYEIGYKNVGNDDVGTVDKNGKPYPCILKDVLPENVNFSLADIDYSNSGGATLISYDPATRTLLFNIPSASLKANGATEFKIRFKVQVVKDCSELKNACTNSIDNTADITYVGVYNKAIVNDLSLNSYTGCNFTPKASNFLVNVAPCIYKQEIPYCGNNVTIVAKPGYQTYSWSSSPTGFPVLKTGIAPDNTYTATAAGTYYVNDITTIVPCKSIQEEIKVTNVKTFPNPILDYAKAPYRGTIDICTIGGKELPKFFLCGANDHRLIITNYGLGSTALWEKLDENSCVTPVPLPGAECANENPACKWNTVGTAKDFDAKDAGQYKVTFSFAGGCVLVYYFNVYKNDLNPTVEKANEYCTTKGFIKIKNVPATGYEFILDSDPPQDSPDFLSVASGNHKVVIRLKAAGATSCDFTIDNIDITKNDMVVAINNLVHPNCITDKGSFTAQAKNVRGPYTFELYLEPAHTLVESATVSGAGGFNSYDFTGKASGNYTLITKTSDGCYDSRSVIINAPAVFTATAVVTKSLTCVDGEITVTPQGGTAPYFYFVNSTTVSQNIPTIAVNSPGGTYNITVRDGKNCSYDIPAITVNPILIDQHTVAQTNLKCYGANIGSIKLNVANDNGYTLAYSIDNGGTYGPSSSFTGLSAGIYKTIVRYTLGTTVCYDAVVDVTITGPTTELTASAGVSALAGCGKTPFPKNYGKVRITNPQGGTPGYTYSFDGGINYIASNEAYVAPGKYTLYIKDAVGCIYTMPGIILEDEPTMPTIQVSDPVFNCNGSANSTVTVINSASNSFSYNYYLDNSTIPNSNPSPNPPNPSPYPPNVFLNVPTGSHDIWVEYLLTSVPTYSNLLFENFGYGDDTTSPGINSTYYCFERQVTATQCKGSTAINDGDYSVTAKIVNPFGPWLQPGDHTPQTVPATPKGRCLVVNIGDKIPVTEILYEKNIKDIIPNRPINVEFSAMNLLNSTNTQFNPDLRVALVDASGAEISWYNTGDIPKSEKWENYPKTAVTLNPGTNTNLKFIVRSNVKQTSGNDVAIDDIRVYQLPEICATKVKFPFVVTAGNEFKAAIQTYTDVTCAGVPDGSITITVENFKASGFEYTTDNWASFKTSTTSPVTISGLSGGTYTVKVRYEAPAPAPAPPGAVSCSFSFDQLIKSPQVIVTDAKVTVVAKCTVGATIVASAIGGTGAYEFQLTNDGGVAFNRPFQKNDTFLNIPPGNYIVTTRDANGCIAPVPFKITVAAPAAVTAAIVPNTGLCFDGSNAKITVNVGGGIGPYSYQTSTDGGVTYGGSTAITGSSFIYTATGTGTYRFKVTDSYGCNIETVDQVINANLTAKIDSTTELDCDVAPNNQAVITGTITGGKAPFTGTVLSGTGPGTFAYPTATTFTYTTAVASTYKFEIKDNLGCVTTATATVNALTPITLGTTNINPKCNGTSDGSIELNPGGGLAPYTYAVSTVSTTGPFVAMASNLYSPAAAGDYWFRVTDAKKCIFTSAKITLAAPAAITGIAKITTPYTCDGPGEITVSPVSGGNVGGYSYTLYRGGVAVAGPQSGVGANVFKNLSVPGNYTVTITDTKGCSFTTTPALTISALNGPTDLDFTYKTFNCSDNTSAFNVNLPSGAGGQTPVKFQIIGVPASIAVGSPLYIFLTQPNSDGQYSGVPAGAYKFQITDKNNCIYTEVYNLIPEPPIVVTGKLINNVKCKGSATGSVEYSISGFATTYSYTINGGSASGLVSSPKITLTNLAAGDYTISVTDKKTGCVRTAMVTVSEPATALSIDTIDKSKITCLATKSDVDINTSGGWGGNSYTVTPILPVGTAVTQATKNFKGLAAGNYTATVTDLNGCIVTMNFTIDPVVGITAAIGVSDFCYDSGDKATLVVSPVTFANYEYSINSGTSQATGTFANLTPGSYTIRVTDTSTGCFKDLAAETIANTVSANTKLNKDLDCDPTNPNAIIEVTISDGYPNYSYKVNTTGAPFTGASTTLGTGVKVFTHTTTTGAAAATYYFEITDAKGCSTIVTRTINAKVLPTATTTPTNPTCFGGTNGSIIINASLGLAPYTYEVSTVSATGPFTSMASNSYSNASAGDYWFRITDDKKCTFTTAKETLTAPSKIIASALATPLTCNTSNVQQAALITVSASNGTPYAGLDPYRYSFNGATYGVSNTFSPNTASTVTIDVKDANGCIVNVPSVTIAPLNPPTAIAFSKNRTINCLVADADVTLTVTGGTPLYKYEITAPAVATTTVANQASPYTFLNLIPRFYTFKVTDSNGCTVTDSYNLTASGKINVINPLVVAHASCNSATDGKIQFTVSGTYVGATGVLTNNLTAAVVNVPAIPAGGNVLDFTGLPAAKYTLTVTNPSTGCTDFATVEVIEPTAVTITSPTTATKVFCSKPISVITVYANGGTSPLSYAVVKHFVVPVPPVPGDYQSSNVFNKDTSVDGLVYDVYVKDKNGCPAVMGTVSVSSDPAPTVTASATGQCLGTGTYTITATPGATVFGTPTYSLNGGGFVSANTFTITTAGDYTITIKDGNGCTAKSNTVTVATKLTLSAILDKDITCAFAAPFTTNDAQITLTAAGGKAPYTYASTPTTGSFAANVFTTNTPGSYTFSITDANGCSVATTTGIAVTAKVDPVIDDTAIMGPIGVTVTKKIRCNGDANAAIAIAIDNTKGQGPFVFHVQRNTPTPNDYGTLTSGLTAGIYTITVTDAKGCTDTEDITIDDVLPIDFDLSKLDIKCTAGGIYTLGSITVKDVVGGTAPFKYYITNNYGDVIAGNPYIATAREDYTFSGIINFGIYTINVVDANGCNISKQITMTSPPSDLKVVIDTSAPSCTDGTATVTVKATPLGNNYTFGIFESNVPPFSSVFLPANNGSDSHIFTGLTPGVTYTFVVHDGDTGCDFVNTANIPIPAASTLAPTITPHNVTCKGEHDGYVSFSITGYDATATSIDYQIFKGLSNAPVSGVLSYTIGDPSPVNYPVLPPLPAAQVGNLYPGPYYIVFTEKGGLKNGCKIASPVFDINESSIPLSITASVTKNSNTCKSKVGVITAIAKNGTATIANPYLYQIFPDLGTVGTIDGTEPRLDHSDLLFDGAFSATFNNPVHKPNTFKEDKGNYIVYVKDANGCIQAAFVSLVDDVAPTITPQTPPCFVAGLKINLDLSTFTTSAIGTPTYSINGTNFQPSPNFTISAPGNFTLAIKDGNGCIASAPYVVSDEIVTGLSVTKQLDCKASPDAIIHGDVAGGQGTGTYSYTVKIGIGGPGASVPIVGTTFDYSAVTADTYTFVITDGTCSVTEIIKVDPKVPTVFNTNVVAVKCFGDNTGSISVDVTSGEGPFEYKLTGGPVSYPYQDSNEFKLLKYGTTYIVTVRSKTNLCEYATAAILPITVGQPLLALAVDLPTIIQPSCGTGNAAQKGTVKLNVTAGTGTGPNYQYSFNGSAYGTANVFDVFDTGFDQLGIPYKVKDSNNCEVSGTVDIFKLNPPVFNLPTTFTQTAVTCIAPNDKSKVTISSTKGVGTITYSILAPASAIGNISGASSGIFTGLAPGDYTFLVKDVNGCTDQVSYKVKDVTKINLQVTSQSDVTCDASATGKASFAVTGFGTGVGTYSCTVNGVAFPLVAPNSNTGATISLTGLAANTYIVRVTDDETGCFSEQTVIIKNPTVPFSSSNTVTPLGCTTKGAVTINTTGGWGNNTYTLTQPDLSIVTNTNGVFGGLTQIGTYNTSVKDDNGCTIPGTFTLLDPALVKPTISSVVVSCPTNNLSTLTVTAASTSTFIYAPFEYSIDNGKTFQSSNIFNNLSPGSYDVLVKDAFGCLSGPTNAKIEPQLFATSVKTKEVFCIAPIDGTIRVTPTGGYSPYTYKVSINGAGYVTIPVTDVAYTDYSVPTAVSSVNYVFEITDSKGCVFVTTPPVVMTPPTPVDLVVLTDIITTPVDCNVLNGTNDNGTITVNLRAVNNNPDYTYALSGAATRPAQALNYFTGLAPGNYDVTVTSGRGCPATVNVTIGDPLIVTASVTAAAFSCAVDPSKTTAVVIAGGGTGTYSFSLDGINYFTSNTLPTPDKKYTFDLTDTGAIQNPNFWVKDSKGCIVKTNLVTPLDPLPKLVSVIATNGTPMDCTLANNKQEMNVVITGGSNTPKAFTYQVYQDGIAFGALNTLAVGDNTFTYNAPTAGHYYTFEVIDNNTTCSLTSIAYDVPLFNKINVVAAAAANVTCNGLSNGAIEINVTGYTGTYDYEILKGGVSLVPPVTGSGDSSITSSFTLPHGLMAGTDYTVSILETAFPSCLATSKVVVITEPAPLTLSTAITVVNKNCFSSGAVVTVPLTSIGGGTSGFTYAFVPAGTPVTPGDFKPSNTITLATTKVGPITALPSSFDAWDVWVKDMNGCPVRQTIQITTDPLPTISVNPYSQCPSLTGDYTFTVVGAGVGPFEYSIGSGFQGDTFVVKAPGKYDITVRDKNGCTNVVPASVTIFDPLQLDYKITGTPICMGNGGEVTLFASGGKVPASYNYSDDNITYIASNVFGTLSPSGTPYTFYVKDMGTGCIKDVKVTFEIPNGIIDFGLTPSPVTCKGDSDGSITVKMVATTGTVNNNPIYTYTINPAPAGMVLVGNVFMNLPQGSYDVTVTSGKGCAVTKTNVVVGTPASISFATAPVVSPYGCTAGSNGTNYAKITVSAPTGGSDVFPIYEFIKVVGGVSTVVQKGSEMIYTETDLLGGNYTINVYDSKGCLGTTTATIDPFVKIDFAKLGAITVTKAIICGNNPEEIKVNVTTTGTAVPMPILDYNLTGVAGNVIPYPSQTNHTGDFIGLTVGSYIITVTNPITGCSIQTVHYVNEPNTFGLKVDKVSDVTCFNSNEGSVNLTFIDKLNIPSKAGAFTYSIAGPTPSGPISEPSAGPVLISGLKAGIYTVTAQLNNSPGCPAEIKFSIDEPTETLAFDKVSHVDITCEANSKGSISVTATGGWGGYEFQLELASTPGVPVAGYAWSSVSEFTGLSSGDYKVRVRDSKLCSNVFVDVKLLDPTPISVAISTLTPSLTCFGDESATITVDAVAGGSGSYLYILKRTAPDGTITKNGPQQAASFSNLGAGTYVVTVSDNWSCSNPSNTVVIKEPTVVTSSLVQASAQTCLSPATLTLSAVGGTGPYTYSTDPSFAVPGVPFVNPNSTLISVLFTNVRVDHTYYVKDSKGCVSYASNSVAVTPLDPLDFKFENNAPQINCLGDKNGQITAIANGGSGNYVYTLLDSAGNPIVPTPLQSTPGYFTNLPAGKYWMDVKSGDCMVARKQIEIFAPSSKLNYSAVAKAVICNGDGNGKLEITANGGTPAIIYALSPELSKFVTTSNFTNLVPGDYTAIIQDLKGCNNVHRFTITEPLPISAKVDPLIPIIQEYCAGDLTGEFGIVIAAGSGTAPYSTSLDDPNGTYVAGQVKFTGLKGGNHTVYVKDANSCVFELVVPLDASVVLDPIAIATYDCVNDLPANKVTVRIDDSNDSKDVDYSLDGATHQLSNVFVNVLPGKHIINARHTNGCDQNTLEFEIKQIDPLAISIDLGGLNEIVATVTGGSGVYQYAVNGENIGSNNKYIYFKSGDYTVTVTDSNGCVASATKYFEFIDIKIPPIFTPTGDGTNETWKPTNTENYPDIKFIVYDRYGRQVGVFGAGQSWDGKYNGTELPMGDYWYVLKLKHSQDDREFIGHFTLYR
jgi:gliding motility-associated-like protein